MVLNEYLIGRGLQESLLRQYCSKLEDQGNLGVQQGLGMLRELPKLGPLVSPGLDA